MSSEISTDAEAPSGARTSDPLQPWHIFTLAGLVAATVIVVMSGSSPWAPQSYADRVIRFSLFGFAREVDPATIVLSLAVFASAAIGVAMLRTLLPLSAAPSRETAQPVGTRTRGALEREKLLVLRSIKELEFDRAMGKLSEKDFAEMSARLRARAARLIRQLDAGAVYRDRIEREIERRVGAAPAAPAEAATRETDPSVAADVTEDASVCASCQTHNDADARFCKSCGTRLEVAS